MVAYKTADRIYTDVNKIPYNEVGMVLGTEPTTMTGNTNSYSLFCIDAAEGLQGWEGEVHLHPCKASPSHVAHEESLRNYSLNIKT